MRILLAVLLIAASALASSSVPRSSSEFLGQDGGAARGTPRNPRNSEELARRAGVILVASSGASHVTLIDDATYATLGTVAIGGAPHELAVSRDHRLAWSADTKDRTITLIDLVHRRPYRTFPLTNCRVHDVRVSSTGELLWATCAPERAVIELDASTGMERKRYDVGQEGAWMVAASPDDRHVVTANLEGGSITFIPRATGVAKSVKTADGEIALDVGAHVWSGNLKDGTVRVWDYSGNQLGTVAGVKAAMRIRLTPDGKRAVIVDAVAKTLLVVDTASREIVKTIVLPDGPKVLALSPDGRRAAVSAPGADKLFVADLTDGTVRTVDVPGKPDGVAWANPPAAPQVEVAATIGARDLIPEGIAFDAKRGRTFVSSTNRRKIVAIGPGGRARDFTETAPDIWGIVGIKVDAERRRLWALTSHAGANMPMVDMDPKDEGRTAVLEFDADGGALLARYDAPDRGRFFNDLAVTPKGDVYITDSTKNAIFTIPVGGKLKPFFQSNDLPHPNGIALTPDGKRLVIAARGQFVTVDLATKRLRNIELPPNTWFRAADGIVVDGHSIIAVQPWMAGREIERYVVDESFTRVLRTEVLAGAHPLFEQPTTATIARNRLLVIANSHLQLFRGNQNSTDLREVAVLAVPLR